MKYLLLLAIRIYWKLPTRLHQRCIFRETCSHYVYRIASTQGLWAGIQAISFVSSYVVQDMLYTSQKDDII